MFVYIMYTNDLMYISDTLSRGQGANSPSEKASGFKFDGPYHPLEDL
jgi:hypothetical protein